MQLLRGTALLVCQAHFIFANEPCKMNMLQQDYAFNCEGILAEKVVLARPFWR
jgi:hypothetical protein